jgi:hypothetical protein
LSKYYGLTEQGNWEGRNILHVPQEPNAFASRVGMSAEELAAAVVDAKRTLYRVRTQRVRPGLDALVKLLWDPHPAGMPSTMSPAAIQEYILPAREDG